jgi:formate hydrogenlyase subunit 4
MRIVLYIVVQLLVILLTAPLVNGVIQKVKARTQKQRGAPLLQMYFDLNKLFKKGSVVSETSSWIFKAAPYIVFSTALAAGLLVPVSTLSATYGLPGDILLLVYLLALGRFFMTLAGLDTASTFGGMGSSREAMISSLMEPSILVSLFTAGLVAGTTSVTGILQKMCSLSVPLAKPVFILMFLAVLIIIIAETSRIPVDDPSTHLELTMVHEAMILEYSGRHLALMEYGASVKQLVFITLLVNICLPHDQLIGLLGITGIMAVALSLLLYLIKVILTAVLIALIEVNTVKFRFFSVPNLAALSFILAFIGFLQYFVLGR